MKKLATMSVLALSIFVLSGCTIFSDSGGTGSETTESSILTAEVTDITNSIYTLKVRKDMSLESGQIIFKDKELEWTRSYKRNTTTSSSKKVKTTLKDVKITTKKEQYIITGNENGKTVEIVFTKIGNFRIKDESGNIYSL